MTEILTIGTMTYPVVIDDTVEAGMLFIQPDYSRPGHPQIAVVKSLADLEVIRKEAAKGFVGYTQYSTGILTAAEAERIGIKSVKVPPAHDMLSRPSDVYNGHSRDCPHRRGGRCACGALL